MARKNVIDIHTLNSILNPYKEMLEEYKAYMSLNVLNEKDNYEKIESIGKSLTLIKGYLYVREFNDSYYSKLLISDINSCLYCIRNSLPKRFFYFSLRSLIESFIRLNIIDKEIKTLVDAFEMFKNENSNVIRDNNLFNNFYSKLKSKYNEASGYVHGSKKLSFSLKKSIEHVACINSPQDVRKMITDLCLLINLIKKYYLTKDENLIALRYLYDRKFPVIKYLLSRKEYELLFNKE